MEDVQCGCASTGVVDGLRYWCVGNGITIVSLMMDRKFYSVVLINAVKGCGVPMIMLTTKNTHDANGGQDAHT